MFLYFSDWTTEQNLKKLEENGFPHAGKLIKVFASNENPSAGLGRQITVVEASGDPFEADEEFKYSGQGPWVGSDLEVYLNHCQLTDESKSKCRALLRFAHSPNLEIAQFAMTIRNAQTSKMLYNHPLKLIDGLDEALLRDRGYGFHLDIFTPRSIERLRRFVDLENPQTLVGEKESITLEKLTPEGPPPTKETL